MTTKTTQPSHLTRGYSIALLASMVLSSTAILIRYLTTTYHVPALVLAYWREFFTALTLVPFLLLLKKSLLRVNRGQLLFMIGYGLVLALFNSLWTISVALNGAAVATVLSYCSTAFTVLLGWLLLGERLNWAKIVAVVVCLTGCAMVSDAMSAAAWHSNLVGILTGILSGLGYAGYSLMGRTASRRGINPWTSVLYAFGLGSCFLLVFNLIPVDFMGVKAVRPAELFWLGNAWLGWTVLFLLAAGPTLAGFGLYNVSLGYLPSSIANLILTLEPVFTATIAYFFLNERLTLVQVGGGLLILAGVVLLRIYEGRGAGRTVAEAEATAS